jgi:hypothetical protein
MFLNVCFSLPSGLRAIVSETIGGTTHTTVKKENGARLVTPAALALTGPDGEGRHLQGIWVLGRLKNPRA